MMIPLRLYIASPDHERLERGFAFDPRFTVLGGSGAGGDALADVLRLCPDALLLDQVLSGLDGIEALKRIGAMMPAPPYTVLLRRTGLPEGLLLDVQCPCPCTLEMCAEAAAEATRKPLPALAGPWEEDRLSIAGALLTQLGTPETLKGFYYLRLAAASLACAPRLGLPLSQGLYPYIAARFSSTPGAVERAVRSAVEYTWLKGNLDAAARLFGLSVDPEKGKPTNAECLFLLAQHVREELARRMAKKAGQQSGAP